MSDRVERCEWIAAPPEAVWDVITGPDWLADEVRLDLRPGGDADFWTAGALRSGWIEEARPPGTRRDGAGRLAFWWANDGEPATRVELRLEPSWSQDGPDGTRLWIVESRPLDVLDLVGTPLPGTGGTSFGPALVAA